MRDYKGAGTQHRAPRTQPRRPRQVWLLVGAGVAIILAAAAIWALSQSGAQPGTDNAAPVRAANGAIPLELPPPQPATLPVDESGGARETTP